MTTLIVQNMKRGYADILAAVRNHGDEVTTRSMAHYELLGVSMHVENPYEPWAEDCGRGLVKAIGWVEGLQLIAGEAYPNLMVDVAGNFRRYQDGEVFHGAYGPRVRDQIPRAIERLDDPGTRQAVITVWDPAYDQQDRRDIPCTVSMQFMVRNGRLHMITHMRSNDVWLGLPYDVFQFTLLQKTIANCLQVTAGPYHHLVGSFHLYETNYTQSMKVFAANHGRATYVDGIDVRHDDASMELDAVDRWEVIRAGVAEALNYRDVSPTNGADSEALREGIDSINFQIDRL